MWPFIVKARQLVENVRNKSLLVPIRLLVLVVRTVQSVSVVLRSLSDDSGPQAGQTGAQ